MGNKSKAILMSAVALAAISLSSCKFDVSKTFDDTKLLIGVPKLQDGDPVYLELSYNIENTGAPETEVFGPAYLKSVSGQDGSAVFVDVVEAWQDFGASRDGESVGSWLSKNGNTLTASTIAAKGAVTSAPVAITKAGVWFVSVAQDDGGEPYGFDPDSDTTYQACYKVIGGIL